ncbi:MAG: BspA family leucine-rich repeat surface protein, partial [Cytophagia bacterium]
PVAGDDVIIASGHTVTLNLNSPNLLTLTVNGTLRLDGYNIDISGATIVSGVLDDNVAGGISTFNGTFTVNAAGTAQSTGINQWNFGGNITNNGTFNLSGNLTYTFTNTLTIQGSSNLNFGQSTALSTGTINSPYTVTVLNSTAWVSFNGTNNFTISGTLINQNTNFTIIQGNMVGAGTFTNDANATLLYEGGPSPTVTNFNVSASGNRFRYNGGTQSIRSATYHHVETSNSGTKSLAGAVTLNGDLSVVASSTLNASTFNMDIKGGMYLAGGGVFAHNGQTVTFSGSGSLSVPNQSPIIFGNLIVNKTSDTDIVYANGNITVNNNLTLTRGLVYLGSSNLTFSGLVANLTRTNGWVVTNGTGALIRTDGGSNLSFPVGSATQLGRIAINTCASNASVRFGTSTATLPNNGAGSWFINNGSTNSGVYFSSPVGVGVLYGMSSIGRYTGTWGALSTNYPSTRDFETSVGFAFSGGTVEFGIYTANPAIYFRTTWQVGGNNIIILTTTGTYNYTISWKNLTSPGTNENSTANQTANHAIVGLTDGDMYEVYITGTFPRIFFNNGGDKTKIKTIEQWGNVAWMSMENAFNGCSSLQLNATDSPNLSAVTSMNSMFSNCTAFTGNNSMNSWNTSNVTDMQHVFNGASSFNQPIGSWNVGAVSNMGNMFQNATLFNQPLGTWNTSNVTNMWYMFVNATSFNQSLAGWNVSNVNNMGGILENTNLNVANYDATLIGWASQTVKPNVTLVFTGLRYCSGFVARNILTSTPNNWVISGDINDCPTFIAITATNVTTTSFTANWTGIIGATSYDIEISTSGSFTGTPTQTGITGVSSVRTGLSPNMTYYYRVRQGTPSAGTWSNTKMISTILPAGSGNTLTFDGTARKVDIPNNASVDFTNANTFTLEAWIKFTHTGNYQEIISKRIPGAGYALQVSDGNLLAVVQNNVTNHTSVELPENTWIHVAASFSVSGIYTLYINGITEGGGTPFPITSNTQNLTIGSRPDNGLPFNGQIDEVRVWNTMRTQAQIRASMCSKLIGNESGLVAYFRLDENTGTMTENKAYGANFDANLIGSPSWATSSAPLGDISVNTYGGSTLTLTDVDAMTINDFSGTPAGIHLYKIKQAPNNLTLPTNYTTLYNSRYFGVFFVGGTNPKGDLTYQYATNTQVIKPNALRFAHRDDPTAAWTQYGAVINRLQAKAVRQSSIAGEYILGERNSITSNARNGGQMILFNGSSQYAQTGNTIVGNDFTIEFWTKMPSNSTISGTNWHQGRPFITMEAAGGTNDYGITLLNNNFAFGTRNSSGIASTIQSTNTVVANAWNHIAITRNSTTGAIQLYVNGKLDVTGTGATGTLSGGTLMNIAKNFASNIYWDGYIDEIRIWNTPLSANTIKDMMNLRANDTHPNFQNLVSYYRFDEGTGIYTEDLQLGSDMQFFNAPTWASADQPVGDGSVQRITVNTGDGASYTNFATPGVSMIFPNSGPYPNGDLVVTRLETAPESYPNVSAPNNSNNFISCYWVIRNYGSNLTFNRLLELRLEQPVNDNLGGQPFSAFKLYKRPDNATGASSWNFVQNATGFGSLRFAGGPTDIDQFSQFIIGSTTAPLSVGWVNFDGQRINTNQVELRWTTATETRNMGFEIQRSTDGKEFTTIGFKDGGGNSSQTRRYSFVDDNASSSYYYRLKQLDIDAVYEYSKLIYIRLESKTETLLVYPNPTTESIQLQTKTEWVNNPNLRAELFNSVGQSVWQGKGNLLDIQESINIWLKQVKSGLYVLRLFTPDKVLESKFIKENK